jgi:hypothetical protein
MIIHGREFNLKDYAYLYDGVRFTVGTVDICGHFTPILRGREGNKSYIVPKRDELFILINCYAEPYGIHGKFKLYRPSTIDKAVNKC